MYRIDPRPRRSSRSTLDSSARSTTRGTARRGTRRVLFAGPAAALLLAGALAGCGTTSPAPTSTGTPTTATGTFDTASATTAVTQTWTTFFSKDTPVAQKQALLENGTTTLAPAVQAFASNPLTNQVTASVQKVTFPTPTTADVTYSISVGGQQVQSAAVGKAVNQNGKWLVSSATLCGLLQLAQSQSGSTAPIPGCGG
jgi:hypothetical protein